MKLYARNEVNLAIAEAALLPERVAKLYESPLVMGRIGDLLEGAEARREPWREPVVSRKTAEAENLDLTNVRTEPVVNAN